MEDIDKYVGECFSIKFERSQNRFKIFTIPTQHFYVDALSELTPEKFEIEITKQKETERLTSESFKAIYDLKRSKGLD